MDLVHDLGYSWLHPRIDELSIEIQGEMKPVNIHEAKTHLSRLLERVEAGEEIVIARSGHPIARLVPIVQAPKQRVPGGWKGKFTMSKDFEKPLSADELRLFEGGDT